mmetsp:Transcript_33025/g.67080  ORF Transcript_33025/g.67080 Transcript_33025/m.67080 type:complete len:212 (+) Transcript_33025:386-1021(+)
MKVKHDGVHDVRDESKRSHEAQIRHACFISPLCTARLRVQHPRCVDRDQQRQVPAHLREPGRRNDPSLDGEDREGEHGKACCCRRDEVLRDCVGARAPMNSFGNAADRSHILRRCLAVSQQTDDDCADDEAHPMIHVGVRAEELRCGCNQDSDAQPQICIEDLLSFVFAHFRIEAAPEERFEVGVLESRYSLNAGSRIAHILELVLGKTPF